jgi:hypothetical protein
MPFLREGVRALTSGNRCTIRLAKSLPHSPVPGLGSWLINDALSTILVIFCCLFWCQFLRQCSVEWFLDNELEFVGKRSWLNVGTIPVFQ